MLLAQDRIGLVYGRPYPFILTSGVIIPSDGNFMAIVLPIECREYLPHEARVPLDVQRKYAAQLTGLAVLRDFYPGSREAYEALDAAMDKVASVETENALNLKLTRKTIGEVKTDLEEPVEQTDAGCADMIVRASASKGGL